MAVLRRTWGGDGGNAAAQPERSPVWATAAVTRDLHFPAGARRRPARGGRVHPESAELGGPPEDAPPHGHGPVGSHIQLRPRAGAPGREARGGPRAAARNTRPAHGHMQHVAHQRQRPPPYRGDGVGREGKQVSDGTARGTAAIPQNLAPSLAPPETSRADEIPPRAEAGAPPKEGDRGPTRQKHQAADAGGTPQPPPIGTGPGPSPPGGAATQRRIRTPGEHAPSSAPPGMDAPGSAAQTNACRGRARQGAGPGEGADHCRAKGGGTQAGDKAQNQPVRRGG